MIVNQALLAMLIAGSVFQGCGKKTETPEDTSGTNGSTGKSTQSEDPTDQQDQQNTITGAGQLNLSFSAINSTPAATALALADTTPAVFHPNSITSGAPEGFRLSITKISLEGGSARETIFESKDGSTLDIQGSTIDLSSLLSAESTGITEDPDSASGLLAAIKPGKYDKIKLDFLRKAEIKGCVRGDFASSVTNSNGVHTYCTQTAGSTFAGTLTTNADFENKTAEWMDFDISSSNNQYFTKETDQTFTLSYDIAGGVEITEKDSASLTFVIDMNRLLRYYNQGRSDQGPNPGAPTDKTYFFDTTFRSSTFAFVGKPGKIFGYEMLAMACANASYDAVTKICSVNSSPVALWMTLIADEAGIPVLVNYMPDDDNTFTVIKGGNSGLKDWVVKNAASMDLMYTLGEDAPGVIKGFPLDLNSTAVGAVVDGVTFEGFQDQSGPVTTTRKL
jgi:hypothetical protein